MTDFKKEIIKKLMVQEELTRGTMAHWGIAKAIEIVEQTPDENAEMRELGTNMSADLKDEKDGERHESVES